MFAIFEMLLIALFPQQFGIRSFRDHRLRAAIAGDVAVNSSVEGERRRDHPITTSGHCIGWPRHPLGQQAFVRRNLSVSIKTEQRLCFVNRTNYLVVCPKNFVGQHQFRQTSAPTNHSNTRGRGLLASRLVWRGFFPAKEVFDQGVSSTCWKQSSALQEGFVGRDFYLARSLVGWVLHSTNHVKQCRVAREAPKQIQPRFWPSQR